MSFNDNNEVQQSQLYRGTTLLVVVVVFIILFLLLATADAGGIMMSAAGESGILPQFVGGIRGFIRLLFNLGIAMVVLFLVATLGGIAKIVQIVFGMFFEACEAIGRVLRPSPVENSASVNPRSLEQRIARLEAKTASIPDPPKPMTPQEELAKLKTELAKLKGSQPGGEADAQ